MSLMKDLLNFDIGLVKRIRWLCHTQSVLTRDLQLEMLVESDKTIACSPKLWREPFRAFSDDLLVHCHINKGTEKAPGRLSPSDDGQYSSINQLCYSHLQGSICLSRLLDPKTG